MTEVYVAAPTNATNEQHVETKTEFRRLMEEMAAGSEEAAWRITEIYTPHIMRAIRATLPNAIRTKADSQDYAQAVWASILLGDADFSRFENPQQFAAYLAATARNKVIESYRRFTRTQAYDIRAEIPIDASDPYSSGRSSTPRPAPKDDLKSKELPASQVARLREQWTLLLDGCSDRDRQIVGMRVSGLQLKEIANQLNVNEKTVRRALSRMLDTLAS